MESSRAASTVGAVLLALAALAAVGGVLLGAWLFLHPGQDDSRIYAGIGAILAGLVVGGVLLVLGVVALLGAEREQRQARRWSK